MSPNQASTERGYALAVVVLSLMALGVGCTGSEPGRTVIFGGAASRTTQSTPTPTRVTPTAVSPPTAAVAVTAPTSAPALVATLTAVPAATTSPTFTPAPTQAPLPTPTPVPTASPTQPPTVTPVSATSVIIECIFFDGVVPTSEADEYVQIMNQGPGAVDLTGWQLRDVADGFPTFEFPSHPLADGGTVRVYTNQVHAEWGGFSFGRGSSIWNNSTPDTAGLFDPQGIQVSTKSYPPGC